MKGEVAEIAELNKANDVQVREQLDRVLGSETFVHGERQSRFLRYVVEQSLSGKRTELNQYSIGIDVFDRDENFDPVTDSIVRVEAGRLRSKLTEFYAHDGLNDAVIIELPKGGYAPKFTLRAARVTPPTVPSFARTDLPRRLIMVLAAFCLMAAVLWTVLGRYTGEPEDPIAAHSDHLSIAVLPFDNMSPDSDQEYFSDGITEDIITDLSVISGLRVIARHSTFVFKDRQASIKEIGEALDVSHVLEGSVRRDGDRLRITAQLIYVTTGAHIWAERFDRGAADVFEVQDEVTRRIVEALEVTLTDKEVNRLGHRRTVDPTAHDLLLRGQEQFYRFDRTRVLAAIDLFGQAIDADPNYADAYAWQARALTFSYLAGHNPSKSETVDAAIRLARKALKVDPDLPAGLANLAWALRWNMELDEALTAVDQAIALDPNFADAFLWKSLILSTNIDGHAALQAINNAFRLNPNYSVTYVFALGRAQFLLGDYEAALRQFRRTYDRNPRFLPGRVYEAFTLSKLDRMQEASRAWAELARTHPNYHQSPSYQSILQEWGASE